MKISDEFVLRKIAEDYIIVPTGKTILEFNGMLTVNEIGAFLWNKLQEEVSFDELVEAVLDEYEVSKEEAAKDIREFLDILIKGKILKPEE